MSDKAKMILLIPVLREQEVIVDNLELFTQLDGDYELVYITTQKENEERIQNLKILQLRKEKLLNTQSQPSFVELLVGLMPRSLAINLFCKKNNFDCKENFWDLIATTYNDLPSTADMIDDYLKKNTQRCQHVFRIHYPLVDGIMAHQLNYTLGQLRGNHETEKSFILIYNADSIINKQALDVFYEKIVQGEKVIMQSSLFLDNYRSFSSDLRGWILKCIALTQSRWTLIHEMSRIRAQYRQGIRSRYESAHVVGHGTCVRLDTLLSVGGFPEVFINEDLPLGYFLALVGERICPVPILENSQSPTTITSVITQYTTWFYGAMDYYNYYRYAIKNLPVSKGQAWFWFSVNSTRAAMWLLAPWVWIFLMVVPILLGNWIWLLLTYLLFLLHTVFVYWLIARFVSHHPEVLGEKMFSISINLGMILVAPIAYIIWGVGPLRSLVRVVDFWIFHKPIYKAKTER